MLDRLTGWFQDITAAWRTLRRSPGFALVSILTLALAIGANTAIFSVARAVLFRPLPYGQPERLVGFYTYPLDRPDARYDLSAPDLQDYRAAQQSLQDIAAYAYPTATTWRPRGGDPQIVNARSVSANMFSLLQVAPVLGRDFSRGEDAPGAQRSVMLSYGFWQRALGGDPAVLGQTLTLYDEPYTVIGVMPKGFVVRDREDMWRPLDITEDLANPGVTRKQHVYGTIARLKDGVTQEAANRDIMAIARRLQQDYPASNSSYLALVEPLHLTLSARFQQPLFLLLGASLAVLLIACANLANLTLARTMGRRTEIAVRAALGAGRGRIARQLLTESILLALIGGMAGIALAAGATRAMLHLNPDALPARIEVGLDLQVLLFSLVLSLGTGVLFGLLPALSAGRSDLHSTLKSQGRGGTARGGERARRLLVVVQIGIAVPLLVGAGLLIRSFQDLTVVNLGFQPEHILTAQLRVDGPRYDSAAAVNQFYDVVLGEIGATPGVLATGAVMSLPMQGVIGSGIQVEGAPVDAKEPPGIGYSMVRGDYFTAMQIPIVEGRGFDASDTPEAPGTALINQAAVRVFFPNGSAVGRRVRIGPNSNAPWTTIIGVVGDTRDESLDTPPKPRIYDNGRRNTWWGSLSVVVRTAGDPLTVIPAVRAAVRSGDPALAVRNFETLEAVVGGSLAARRFALGLASAFAVLALVLAALGIYGVLAYSVMSRTREFGVRLALGAPPRSVLALVLRDGFGWSLLGLALGIGAALAGGRLLAGMLYGVTPADATTYGVVTCGLLLVVALACLLPARRATQVDPLTSIRAE